MNKYIVTTTINKPTKATLKFCKISEERGWVFVIVGDTSTPHDLYKKLEGKFKSLKYLHPDYQSKRYKKLSDSLGWKTIRRRNLGFVYAYQSGAEIIATVDDDNIPYSDWGQDLLVGSPVKTSVFEPKNLKVFDPLSATNQKHIWHRGLPIELIHERESKLLKEEKRGFLVQADLWDGDPDIDAIARLALSPEIKFEKFKPFCSDKISPFNSQNTFLSRKVIPNYMMIPFVGRFDDIWGSYIMQYYHPKSVVYNNASVYQDRNDQDLLKNLKDEFFGYRNTLDLLRNLSDWKSFLPNKSKIFIDEYQNCFNI